MKNKTVTTVTVLSTVDIQIAPEVSATRMSYSVAMTKQLVAGGNAASSTAPAAQVGSRRMIQRTMPQITNGADDQLDHARTNGALDTFLGREPGNEDPDGHERARDGGAADEFAQGQDRVGQRLEGGAERAEDDAQHQRIANEATGVAASARPRRRCRVGPI